MAAQNKSGSRWGSFLQQAVAGVESRLDTILADSDEPRSLTSSQHAPPGDRPGNADTPGRNGSPKITGELSRHSSVNQKPERLQERLARAFVNGNSTRSSSVSESGRIAVPLEDALSLPPAPSPNPREPQDEPDGSVGAGDSIVPLGGPTAATETPMRWEDLSGPTRGMQIEADGASTSIRDLQSQSLDGRSTPEATASSSANDAQEAHHYLERIDALEAKLRFMTEESAALARRAAGHARPGSPQRSLAEKEEKIALLVAEGQSLSQAEMKHLAIIKRLRLKSSEDEKRLLSVRRESAEAHKTASNLQGRLDHAQSSLAESKAASQRREVLSRELDSARAENQKLASQIDRLQKQSAENEASKIVETEARLRELLDVERSRSIELETSLSAAKTSMTMSEDRHKEELQELQATAEREKERAKLTELDLRREIQGAEGRLETYLSRAEEITSEHTGDSQAKLVRQIEVLQNSYTIASDNWREIEKSLLAQTSRLENELADSNRREAEMRRKARECSGRCRELELRLDRVTQDAQESRENRDREQEKSLKLEAALSRAQEGAESATQEVKNLKAALSKSTQVVEEENSRAPSHLRQPQIQLPAPISPGSFNDAGARFPQSGLGLTLHERNSPVPVSGRSVSRALPARENSSSSVAQYSGRDGTFEDQSAQRDAQEGTLALATTPATPDRTINDMFSVSTAAAGPSVQLVERMSASVRRLESEKTALREELDRHATQRSEAREQIVSLMGELDQKQASETRAAALEKEVKEMSVKLATTLEMLGEKSEQVEELRADVADMKEIYRSTLENTVK